MVLLSKNKFFVITLLLSGTVLLTRCNSNKESETKETSTTDTATCSSKKINPNGDSELALLMRKMIQSSASLKELVKQGKLPDKFPEEFLKIHTAKPTDSDTKKASFDGFATNYLDNLNTFYHSPKEELTKNYNAVINSCVSCHSEHCPGPIKAIKKLSITQY